MSPQSFDFATWIEEALDLFSEELLEKSDFVAQAMIGVGADIKRLRRVAALTAVLENAKPFAPCVDARMEPPSASARREAHTYRIRQAEETCAVLTAEVSMLRLQCEHLTRSAAVHEAREKKLLRQLKQTPPALATPSPTPPPPLPASQETRGTPVRRSVTVQTVQSGSRHALEAAIFSDEFETRCELVLLYLHRLAGFSSRFEQIRRAAYEDEVKRSQKRALHATTENEMLHEELSLCLRSIATLEARAVEQMAVSPATARCPAVEHAGTQTSPSTHRERCEDENEKLRLLLLRVMTSDFSDYGP